LLQRAVAKGTIRQRQPGGKGKIKRKSSYPPLPSRERAEVRVKEPFFFYSPLFLRGTAPRLFPKVLYQRPSGMPYVRGFYILDLSLNKDFLKWLGFLSGKCPICRTRK